MYLSADPEIEVPGARQTIRNDRGAGGVLSSCRNGTDRCPCARSRSMERHDALTLHAPGSTREYVNVDVDGHSRRAYVKLRGQRV